MTKVEPKILKGFRDFLPKEAKKRQYVINALKEVFELYGFEPLETPALEYEEVLLGKYGEEGDKLMYRFTDRGGRKVALRYDQTVPLARVVAQYGNELPMPFKRYQIQPVWRAENPQKGRFREFLQCDADIVGSSSPLADSEVIAVAVKSLEKLGFKNFKILINDRSLFENVPKEAIRVLDKLKKIGKDAVLSELIEQKIAGNKDEAVSMLESLENKERTQRLDQIFRQLEQLGIRNFLFSPTLARGLDYYTGMIFEIEIEGYSGGSIAGGGRYDNLIGLFAVRQVPAVGFSFGFDRLIEAMEKLNLFPKDLVSTKVLVTIFSKELKNKSLALTPLLRSNGVSTEIYLNEDTPLDKQLKYANQKNIPYVVIIGPEEARENKVALRDMKNKTQKTITPKELFEKFAQPSS